MKHSGLIKMMIFVLLAASAPAEEKIRVIKNSDGTISVQKEEAASEENPGKTADFSGQKGGKEKSNFEIFFLCLAMLCMFLSYRQLVKSDREIKKWEQEKGKKKAEREEARIAAKEDALAQKSAAEREKQRKRQRILKISESYFRVRERVREIVSRKTDLAEDAQAMLSQLNIEYLLGLVVGFSGIDNEDYFFDEGWRRLLDIGEKHGHPVCRQCLALDPETCDKGHCLDCHGAYDKEKCFTCAQEEGKDVCPDCRRIEPERCPDKDCGRCGCSVTIYSSDCSYCEYDPGDDDDDDD